MGERGRDRAAGRALSLGWDDDAAAGASGRGPSGSSDPAGSTAPRGGSAPHGGPAPHGGSAFRVRSPRTRRLLAVGCVLALVAALFVGLPRLLSSTAGPERVTGEFLQAVIDGDLETVLAHAEDDPDASAAALTAQVLAEANEQLESFEIQHVEVAAGAARVTAVLHTGTARSEATFTLTATDAGPFSPLAWELAPVALPEFLITVPFGAQEIAINGVSIPVAELGLTDDPFSPRVAVQLLPGEYEISLPESRRWLEASTLALEAPPTFGNWRKPVHGLQYDLDEDGLREVQRKVSAALEECTVDTSPAPEGCPFSVPDTPAGDPEATAAQGTWALTDQPRVDVLPSDTFLWMVYGAGTAEFTPHDPAADGTARDEGGAAAPIQVPIELEGTATIDGEGELDVALRSSTSFSYSYCVDAETGAFDGVFIREDVEDAPESWDACD